MKELILLSALGALSLIAGLLKMKKHFLLVVIAGLILNIVFCISDWNLNEEVYGMMKLDNFALTFTIISNFIAIVWFIVSSDYFKNTESFSDHFALILFSMCGGLILVSFTNMVMLFLGVEILSIPLFVLAGSHKTRVQSNEAAFKYFLLGAFASAFLLFGITLLYGYTGHFDNQGISDFLLANGNSNMAFIGIVLLLAAMAFKVSAAPFHLWAPDVYQGSPTMVTAFMATFVKTVAFAGFFRLFQLTFLPVQSDYAILFACIASATMLIANITASVQENVKRMLAYSSISHAGFMSITLLGLNQESNGILLYYTLVYSISSIVAFTIFKLVKQNSSHEEGINIFNGLIRRNRLLAAIMAFALLSMSGIPPLAGFMAKYLVFTSAIKLGYMWVTVAGILASLVAVYYYFKLILSMFGSNPELPNFTIPAYQKYTLIVCSLLLFVLMLIPDAIIHLI